MTASVVDVSDAPDTPSPTVDDPAPSAAVADPPVADPPATDLDGGDVVDLDAIERELEGVERALERLSDGSYWTDEVTGEPLPDHVLAADPTARRA